MVTGSRAAADREAGRTSGSTFPNPLLVVVSGPSGVGKSTIVAELARRRSAGRADRDRHDPRATRPGEIDKVHYHFLSPEEFQQLRDGAACSSHAVVHDNWYGTPVDQVRGILAAGRDAILTIDPQGARSVRRACPTRC